MLIGCVQVKKSDKPEWSKGAKKDAAPAPPPKEEETKAEEPVEEAPPAEEPAEEVGEEVEDEGECSERVWIDWVLDRLDFLELKFGLLN